MDTNDMRQLLNGYLTELNWAGGITKDDLLEHLAGRDDTLRMMVSEYVAEGTYAGPGAILTLIPEQAWQDAQGDTWRGPTSLDPEDVDSGFQQSPVGRAESRGTTQSRGASGSSTTSSSPTGDVVVGAGPATGRNQGQPSASPTGQDQGIGDTGSNAGEVDPGLAAGTFSTESV